MHLELSLHFFICLGKSAIEPAPQGVVKTIMVEPCLASTSRDEDSDSSSNSNLL
jgi:hypothetical protein